MKVSVQMITYNHEPFIAQAIDSVLMQETGFDYELVIGEDCSTDRTREIVVDYQRRYPDRIRLLLRDHNLGAHANAAQTLAACQGEYTAVLEGDDCWTSPHKLQKQVDFLDSHPECAICFHQVRAIDQTDPSRQWNDVPPTQKEFSSIEDLFDYNFISTASVMYRNGLVSSLPEWCYQMPAGDWPFHILNAQFGSIGYLDETMAVYRLHAGGVWSQRSQVGRLAEHIRMLECFDRHLGHRYGRAIDSARGSWWHRLAQECTRRGIEYAKSGGDIASFPEKLDEWTQGLRVPRGWRQRVMRELHAPAVFCYHRQSDLAKVRRHWPSAVWHDPGLLLNRGVWSIGAEAFLGPAIADGLRHMVRVALRKSGRPSP